MLVVTRCDLGGDSIKDGHSIGVTLYGSLKMWAHPNAHPTWSTGGSGHRPSNQLILADFTYVRLAGG